MGTGDDSGRLVDPGGIAEAERPPRPLIERLGIAVIAGLLAAVFAFVGAAAWSSGEIFLGVMAAIGALMTVWAAASTLRRD